MRRVRDRHGRLRPNDYVTEDVYAAMVAARVQAEAEGADIWEAMDDARIAAEAE